MEEMNAVSLSCSENALWVMRRAKWCNYVLKCAFF